MGVTLQFLARKKRGAIIQFVCAINIIPLLMLDKTAQIKCLLLRLLSTNLNRNNRRFDNII